MEQTLKTKLCAAMLIATLALPVQATGDDLAALRAELDALNARVTRLESQPAHSSPFSAPDSTPTASATDARWRKPEAWAALKEGMSTAQVEALLGTEHRSSSIGPTGLVWPFGSNPAFYDGYVQFADGKLMVWQSPQF